MEVKKFNYSKLKYFGIIDFNLFENLSIFKKKQLLIDYKLFFISNKNYSKNKNSFYLENVASFNIIILHQAITYQINYDIVDEYINYFTMSFNELLNGYYEGDILLSNKIDLEKLLTIKQKNKYLKKVYQNSIKFIKNKEELDFIKIPNDTDAFIKIKDFTIENNPNDLLNYLLGVYFPENGSVIFDYCAKLWTIRKLLFFCTENIESLAISDVNPQKKTKKKDNRIIDSGFEDKFEKMSNYPLVFINLKTELIFKAFLKTLGAIDENNNPVNGVFQPASHAFYDSAKLLEYDEIVISQKIFQVGKNKFKFIEMLIKEYGLSKTTTKLSNGKNYQNNALKFITKSLQN
ncbi:hypothetical protein [Polaribacter glomeratus]|uniref:Uncharacterized protein n=1 Tax=Polaribacter glomeratus TaxID=102 RepID=A0A2S7WFL0_9FLAO|nr:hypothetical protein [Polaribacter glomeratus]PQJ76400.1 hypothetical protein BTO16_10830 [Polaribacter glomeratus]TXD65533.1 hypothetical protein ESX12_10135 [Polaribacter glomeratus]